MENKETAGDADRPWQSYHTVYTNAKAGISSLFYFSRTVTVANLGFFFFIVLFMVSIKIWRTNLSGGKF